MAFIPQISDPFVGAFAGGLFYGLAVCTASCLPIVAGYIAGVGSGFQKSVKITLFFNSGRLLAYVLIGGLIGLLGGLLHLFTSEVALAPFQAYASLAFGVVSILIGCWLLIKAKKTSCECSLQSNNSINTAQKLGRHGIDFGAFTLGLSRGLILCPPLIALLAYALPFATPLESTGIALMFGLGTTISPILLLGGVTGWLLNKAPLLRKWISVGGSVILIALGVITILSFLTK